LNQAEVLAIQRLIQAKQREGDDKVVRNLKENLLRKQARMFHLSSKVSQVESNYSAFNHRPNEECFSLMIVNNCEGFSGATDALAWRMFWQVLRVHFAAEVVCGTPKGSDAASEGTKKSVERALAQIADVMEKSRAQRKFLFVFISCPVSESNPAALQLDSGQRVTFQRLHEWLGSLSEHECMLVFETGGSAFAQTAIDASCVQGFSGSVVCGCLGLVDASVHCSSSHPLRFGIGSDMGLLSFTIIEALLAASTSLRCDEVCCCLFHCVSRFPLTSRPAVGAGFGQHSNPAAPTAFNNLHAAFPHSTLGDCSAVIPLQPAIYPTSAPNTRASSRHQPATASHCFVANRSSQSFRRQWHHIGVADARNAIFPSINRG
jgi:hypothetical protein